MLPPPYWTLPVSNKLEMFSAEYPGARQAAAPVPLSLPPGLLMTIDSGAPFGPGYEIVSTVGWRFMVIIRLRLSDICEMRPLLS